MLLARTLLKLSLLEECIEYSNKPEPILVWESALETRQQIVERPQQDGICAVPGRMDDGQMVQCVSGKTEKPQA